MYDLIIIGGGPAGLTAAIYASRAGLKTLILEKRVPGGKLSEIPHLENFPGLLEPINGMELAMKMYQQATKFGTEIKYPEAVVDLELDGLIKKVRTRKGEYRALAVIIATGLEKKKALVPGEAELLGKGVSYCAVCDGPLYRGRQVAVLGNNDKAVEEAIFLSNLAEKVYLITDGLDIEAPKALIKKMEGAGKIEVVKAKLIKIVGEKQVEKVVVEKEGSEVEIPISAIFIAKGDEPKTEIFKKSGLRISEAGFITVNEAQETNIKGVYAAGDCTGRGMQVVVAAGDGAVAALSATRYIRAIKAKMSKVKHEQGLFYIEIEHGKRAYHRFEVKGDTMKMMSTYTPPEYRGLGLASRIVDEVIMHAKKLGIRNLIVECSYVKHWIEKNPDKVSNFQVKYDIKA